jgi:hypothetical protein
MASAGMPSSAAGGLDREFELLRGDRVEQQRGHGVVDGDRRDGAAGRGPRGPV